MPSPWKPLGRSFTQWWSWAESHQHPGEEHPAPAHVPHPELAGVLGLPWKPFPLRHAFCKTSLTVPGIWLLSFFPFWELPFLSFFFFLAVSLCSFCLFCTSMRTEIKLFFTSFSNSSSSRRANCCTSSSEYSLMAVSISSRSSFNSDTESLFTPMTKRKAQQILRQQCFKWAQQVLHAKERCHILSQGWERLARGPYEVHKIIWAGLPRH